MKAIAQIAWNRMSIMELSGNPPEFDAVAKSAIVLHGVKPRSGLGCEELVMSAVTDIAIRSP